MKSDQSTHLTEDLPLVPRGYELDRGVVSELGVGEGEAADYCTPCSTTRPSAALS